MNHTDAANTLEFIKILTERVGEENLKAKIKTLTLKVLAEMKAELLTQQAAPAAPLSDDDLRKLAEAAAEKVWPGVGSVGWTEQDMAFYRAFYDGITLEQKQ